MFNLFRGPLVRMLLAIVALVSLVTLSTRGERGPETPRLRVATGQFITPFAAPGATVEALHTDLRSDTNANAANAVSSALSPDGKTLLILTSGFNNSFFREDGTPILYPVLDPATGLPTGSTTSSAEWLFVYDVSRGAPVQKQKFNLPVTYNGLAWDPSGARFYVSGGAHDIVYPFRKSGSAYQLDAPFIVLNTGGQLDDTKAGPSMHDFGLAPFPVVAGLGVSSDGRVVYAANFENDSMSLVDVASRQVTERVVFTAPGDKTATGEYPFWIAVRPGRGGHPDKVFVSSLRDGHVVVFDGHGPFRTIDVESEPNKMALSKDGTRLYVANGDADSVSIIDTDAEKPLATISLRREGYPYNGANPNSLALSPDERSLYVTLGGENAVAVVNLRSRRVAGRIPTGWYPNSVSVSADGRTLYVINGKSMPGPNPGLSGGPNPTFKNEYIFALQKASLMSIPVPDRDSLEKLSDLVDRNNGFDRSHDDEMMEYLQTKIRHVIYIVKENRTFDQVLGDLGVGDGDPSIVMFPEPVTPNHHKLARDFVTLDNFHVTGEVSGDGWSWSTQARTNDYNQKSATGSAPSTCGPRIATSSSAWTAGRGIRRPSTRASRRCWIRPGARTSCRDRKTSAAWTATTRSRRARSADISGTKRYAPVKRCGTTASTRTTRTTSCLRRCSSRSRGRRLRIAFRRDQRCGRRSGASTISITAGST